MKKIINNILQEHSLIYKIILYVLTVVLIVFLFPKGGKFKYDYLKGKPWLYENYYAPFNFAIQKSQETIDLEKSIIEKNTKLYFEYSEEVVNRVQENYLIKFNESPFSENPEGLLNLGEEIILKIYEHGFIDSESELKVTNDISEIVIRKATLAIDINPDKLINARDLLQFINNKLRHLNSIESRTVLLNLISEVVEPNVKFDSEFTEKVKTEEINNISYTTGFVAASELIILKGDIVEGKKFEALNSIQHELESQIWSESNYNWIVFGYTILVALTLLMLMLFLRKYRPEIFEDNTKTSLIFINIALVIFLVTVIVKYDAKYVYAMPLCILIGSILQILPYVG